MKRIDEKVKDIVEVRSNVSLSNFAADPLQTAAGYHFTDITADLMSKWIKGFTRVGRGNGAGFALAGFRGVGKSHFLATFGAILSHPEVRSRIDHDLVSSAAHGLARRSYSVALLRRGSRDTLLEELKDAVAPLLGSEPASLSDSINELLLRSSECSGDAPMVLLIDTDMERTSRVSRDDGHLVSEIADNARALGVFVGMALDDDISGADGANSAISHSFVIDYLDQEHLYKIVDTNIFPKQARMQPVLHDIYESYRSVLPNFRWSEARFSSLYPLHPAIMEIAPFVRLYMHEFALLSFASEAGSRILGRPANSLIAPDEVFDKVEKSLRGVEALKPAFAAFDKINDEVVAKVPVMKRLQAKLILKGLFLFSLNDEGASAVEIGASMLIFDENDPDAAVAEVESLIGTFAEAVPDGVTLHTDANGVRRFRFKLDGKEDLKTALDVAAERLPEYVVDHVLRKLIEDRYSDCSFAESRQDASVVSTDCVIEWRGGLRKGRVFWPGEAEISVMPPAGIEWNVVLEIAGRSTVSVEAASDLPAVTWKAAEMTSQEIGTIKRFYVAVSDGALRSDFEEHIAAAVQAHAIQVEKIFQRSFFEQGVLAIEGFEYNFAEEALTAGSLSQVFTVMLESLFEGRYPLHPYFSLPIRMKEVSSLVADLFGGAAPELTEIQHLAEAFGVPLGIVSKPDTVYVPAEGDALRELPQVRDILEVIKRNHEEVAHLETIFGVLGEAPNGLVREAGYLLLAAMVSGRLLEFVTSNGDRINHRSLDLQLIWDDIVGVALPADSAYSNERLIAWARLLTGDGSLRSIHRKDDQKVVAAALDGWLDRWNDRRLAARFDSVDDEMLNTRIWRLARTSIKAFRIVAESIAGVREGSLTPDACLQRIADAFADSETEFDRLSADLGSVEEFIAGTELRQNITGWLSLCEVTGVPQIDELAVRLDDVLNAASKSADGRSNTDLETIWAEFKREYSSYFIEQHEKVHASNGIRDKLAEILRTDIWWEFDNLSDIAAFDVSFRSRSRSIMKRIEQFDCRFDTAKLLQNMPLCACQFTLGQAEEIGSLPGDLWQTVNRGLESFRGTIRKNKDKLIAQIGSFCKDNAGLSVDAVEPLSKFLDNGKDNRRLSDDELRFLRVLYERAPDAERGSRSARPYADISASDVDDMISAVPASEARTEVLVS